MTNLTGFLFNRSITNMMPILLADYYGDNLRATAQSFLAFLVLLVMVPIIYVAIALCVHMMLRKLDYDKAWMAWIPFANTYAILEAGEQHDPLIWTIIAALVIIPEFGWIFFFVSLAKVLPAWINICYRLNKSPYILLTWLLCGLGFLLVPGILAFT
jgi:hypothetical protein